MTALSRQTTPTDTSADFPTLLHQALQIVRNGKPLPEDLLHRLSLLAPDRKRLFHLLKNVTEATDVASSEAAQQPLTPRKTMLEVQIEETPSTEDPTHVPSADEMSFSEWINYINQKLEVETSSSPPTPPTPVSETYARLLIQQGHYEKAIKIYQKLMQLHPEKSNTFALQIEQLKKQR